MFFYAILFLFICRSYKQQGVLFLVFIAFKMSSQQSNKEKPRSNKCRHFCFPFDVHNDDPCVTFETPCPKIAQRKRYIRKQKTMTLLKQSHNYVFHSNPQHLNLHAWCLGVDSSKNKASLWRWQRELLHLRGHQQEPSTSQSGPYLRNGAEKIRWISPLHL